MSKKARVFPETEGITAAIIAPTPALLVRASANAVIWLVAKCFETAGGENVSI